ncbi:type II secretion system F family protein [Chitinibacteraceae bacterium HSL-7]
MRFKVKAISGGRLTELELEASDQVELRERLAARGMQLVSAQAERKLTLRKSTFALSLFTQELIALLEAGLTLIEAIETLHEKSGADASRTVLSRIIEGLYQGQPLSKVLAQLPEHFPPLYVATVSSAERSGALSDALKRYHHYEQRLAEVRKKVVSALVYPMVVITIGGGIMLFLLFYVIPKFAQIYASMKTLPFAAQMMLWWGELVLEHGKFMLAGIVATIVTVVMVLRTDRAKKTLAELFWRLPKLEQYRTLFSLTRFYRTVGLLLAGGLSVVSAMSMAAQLLPAAMRLALERAMVDIKSGQALSATLPRYGLTTPVSERLLRVGEQSGDLATMTERAAQFCDEELERAIEMFTRLFEPILMLVIGVLIGTIVFLLYMPIFELAGNMQ